MSAEFGGSAFGRGTEAPEEVIVGRAVAWTRGLQPEDLGVLVYLLLLPVGALASAKDLAAGMREMGWKMSIDRFEVIAKRLMKAGHLNRESVYDARTKRPQWRYWAYRNPANNPEYVNAGATALSQVNDRTGENPLSQGRCSAEVGESPVSPGQGQNRGISDFGESRTGDGLVDAGQGRNQGLPDSPVHPPHPPVGGGNTTPSPRKTGRAAKWAAACALDPEDYAPTEEEIKSADAFLQDLPGKWQMGIDEARALAPLLASRAHVLELDLDLMLQLQLMQDDPKDPARVPSRVMPTRIRSLKRRRVEPTGAVPDAGGLAEWCGECNRGEFPMAVYQRTVELPDGSDAPCPGCHPKHVRA